jgi:hypothetical protein
MHNDGVVSVELLEKMQSLIKQQRNSNPVTKQSDDIMINRHDTALKSGMNEAHLLH